MSVKFKLDYSDVEALEEKFKQIPDNVENLINSYLHHEGVELVKRNIRSHMPISSVKKRASRHAKTSKSLRHRTDNLGFEVSPFPRFNYLVFPDQALGTSKGKSPQKFMELGLKDSTDEILREINKRVDEKIKEVLS